MASAGLGPGDPAPRFTLETPWGVEVSLRDVLVRHAVILEFLRGTWDPAARERLEALALLREETGRLGARILAVTCETSESALEGLAGKAPPFPLLLDPERTAAKAYGVYRRFSYGALHVARPATFVLDRCGYVRFARVGRSPVDAAPPEEILEALRALRDEERGVRGR